MKYLPQRLVQLRRFVPIRSKLLDFPNFPFSMHVLKAHIDVGNPPSFMIHKNVKSLKIIRFS